MSVRLARWLTALTCLSVFIACALPGHDLPEVDVINFDKFVHVGMFAILGWFLLHALGPAVKRRIGLALLLGVAYGTLIEVYQAVMPIGRSGDVIDAVADALGILLAIIAFTIYNRRRAPANSHVSVP